HQQHPKMPLCGGTGEARQPSPEEVELLVAMRPHVESRLGRSVEQFEPRLVATQVVAGTNYFAKVHIGSDSFVHIRVFKPLPHTNEPPALHGIQAEKSASDELAFFSSE
ncbi:hypothetical protein BOX15_Mlig030572g3, partial [Macrostomum lignano]